jgi:nitroreductase
MIWHNGVSKEQRNHMNVYEAIMTRRSTRQFKDIPVEEEKLDQILQAGRYAPSGGNSQSVHFLVIENKEVLNTLADMVQREFAKMEVTENMYRSMANSILRSKAGGYVFHYNASFIFVISIHDLPRSRLINIASGYFSNHSSLVLFHPQGKRFST